jgi:hypothetical protein
LALITLPFTLRFIGRHAATLRSIGAMLLCFVLCLPAFPSAADNLADLKRALEELKVQNRELARRITALEAETAETKQATLSQPAPMLRPSQPPPKAAQKENENLEERVNELEVTKAAEEDSIRSIIQSALSKIGPQINEFVTLGGSLEVTAARVSDFSGASQDSITLSNAELDLEIRASDWVTGYMATTFDTGNSLLFPTTPAFNTGVDRLTHGRAVRRQSTDHRGLRAAKTRDWNRIRPPHPCPETTRKAGGRPTGSPVGHRAADQRARRGFRLSAAAVEAEATNAVYIPTRTPAILRHSDLLRPQRPGCTRAEIWHQHQRQAWLHRPWPLRTPVFGADVILGLPLVGGFQSRL